MFCFASAAGVVVLATPAPAQATVTGATISMAQPSYTGPCPATIAFSGTISGTPGSAFTYSFNRFVNGVQQVAAGAPAIVPNSGSVSVKDAITITASTSGKTFDQIWVHNIVGGQADVYSNVANFSVNCEKFGVLSPNDRPVIKLATVTINNNRWGWRQYQYKWVGLTSYIPEVGTGPCVDLCVGWVHIKNGDSFWLYHWNYYTRGFMLFDLSSLGAAKKVSQATLTLNVSGDPSCFGRLGRATTTWWTGGKNPFEAPYPTDGDFSPAVTANVGPAKATFDVTTIVNGWLSGWPNQGFVARAKTEDNGSDGNDSCAMSFAPNGTLTVVP